MAEGWLWRVDMMVPSQESWRTMSSCDRVVTLPTCCRMLACRLRSTGGYLPLAPPLWNAQRLRPENRWSPPCHTNEIFHFSYLFLEYIKRGFSRNPRPASPGPSPSKRTRRFDDAIERAARVEPEPMRAFPCPKRASTGTWVAARPASLLEAAGMTAKGMAAEKHRTRVLRKRLTANTAASLRGCMRAMPTHTHRCMPMRCIRYALRECRSAITLRITSGKHRPASGNVVLTSRRAWG
jgi:hypothetical protein